MDDLRSVLHKAADIAAEVPESMQGSAFLRVFDVLIQDRGIGIDGSTQEQPGETEPSTKKRGGKRPGRTAPTKKATTRKRAPSRAGPKGALRDLATTPFLKDGRSISEIQKHLESKKALRFELHDLSGPLAALVREDVLEREKNEDGKYVYRAAGG